MGGELGREPQYDVFADECLDHATASFFNASARVPDARFRTHDLADPLDWIEDGAFDLALCALAIEYVDD